MELALAVRKIWLYRIWLIPVAAAAIIAALAVTYHVDLIPPSIHSKSFQYGAASTQVLVDTQDSSLADLETPIQQVVDRAGLYAQLLNTGPVRQNIGKLAKVPGQTISVTGQTGYIGEPKADERSSQIVATGRNRSIFFYVNPGQPIINLYAQAPTASEALRMVSASVTALKRYVIKLQSRRDIPQAEWVNFQQLGKPQAGILASQARNMLGFIVGLFVFIVGCFLILLIPRLILDVRKVGAMEGSTFESTSTQLGPAKSNGELSNGSSPALDPGPEPVDRT